MTGCAEWKDAVADCALADLVEPALAAHLAVCPGCASALHECRATVARMNEALNRRAAVEPPVYGPEQVMARIGGRHRADTRWWWKWAAAGSAAVLLMVIVLWTRRPTLETGVRDLSSWRSPTQGLLRPPVATAWNTTPRLGEGILEIKP